MIMRLKNYTAEQIAWINANSRSKVWKNMKEFTDSFNLIFNEDRTATALNSKMNKLGIKIKSDCSEADYSVEQMQWIKDNATAIEWRNQKHFIDTFNAVFNTHKSIGAINSYSYKHNITVKTKQNTDHYTDEMKLWLLNNYVVYDQDFARLARDFNSRFSTNWSSCKIIKWFERQGIHKPKKKQGKVNKGTFVKGHSGTATDRQLPIGTIRTSTASKTKTLYIKVKLAEGESGILSGNGHNYKRPWWIPLKEKVWIDAYGEIPDGFSIIQLDRNYENCNLDNLALADKRGLAIMGSHKWWTDNAKFNRTGIQWCNLYMTAKDRGVM